MHIHSRTAAAMIGCAALLAAGAPLAGPADAVASSRPPERPALATGLAPRMVAGPAATRALAPRAVAVVVPATTFGVHPLTGQPPAGLARSWRLWDSGTDWCAVQPTSATRYDFRALDAVLRRAAAAQVTDLLLVLGCTPRWAQTAPANAAQRAAARKDVKGYNTSAPPRRPADYGRFVAAMTKRIKAKAPRTMVWVQPWNEANLSSFYRGTPAQMADLTARARAAARAVNARYRVVAASTTLRLAPDYRRFYPPYLKALKARGWPVDAFAVHSYPKGTGTPADRRALVTMAKRDLRAARAPARPLWDTELNFGLRGPGPGFPFSPKSAAVSRAWIARAYLDSIRLGVARTYWYAWSPAGGLLGITLTTNSPAATSLATLATWLTGTTWRGCTAGDVVRCTFTRGAARFEVSWTERGSARIVVAPGRTICTLDGACRGTTRSTTVTLGVAPVQVR